jgi:hypothetical protein
MPLSDSDGCGVEEAIMSRFRGIVKLVYRTDSTTQEMSADVNGRFSPITKVIQHYLVHIIGESTLKRKPEI